MYVEGEPASQTRIVIKGNFGMGSTKASMRGETLLRILAQEAASISRRGTPDDFRKSLATIAELVRVVNPQAPLAAKRFLELVATDELRRLGIADEFRLDGWR